MNQSAGGRLIEKEYISMTDGMDNLDFREFRNAVSVMRYLQKLYFKTRDREVMEKAKTAEKTVDQILESLDRPLFKE